MDKFIFLRTYIRFITARKIMINLDITDSSFPRAHMDKKIWCLDVGTFSPRIVVCSKGSLLLMRVLFDLVVLGLVC